MRRVDLVLHRVYGAHSTRLWIEALVDARFGPVDTGPATIDEITIDDVLKPTAFCADADNPTADNPAPCSLVVGEPRRISPAELCDNPYRPGEMPLPARAGPGRQMLLALNEDADWVLNVLANLGTKAPQLRAEAREQVLGDWIEEMVRGVRRLARPANA